LALTGLTASLSKIAVALVFITASIRFALGGDSPADRKRRLGGRGRHRRGRAYRNCPLRAFAAELEEARGRTVLPLGRRMRGSLAVVGSLEEQMKHAPNEAGVRQTL